MFIFFLEKFNLINGSCPDVFTRTRYMAAYLESEAQDLQCKGSDSFVNITDHSLQMNLCSDENTHGKFSSDENTHGKFRYFYNYIFFVCSSKSIDDNDVQLQS